MKILIIAGGKFEYKFAVSFLEKNKYDYVIAVDKGLEYAKKLSVVPDLWLGDFDSVSYKELGAEFPQMEIQSFNSEKDETDTELAVNKAVQLKGDFDIICGMGGRMDHFFGVIHNLKRATDVGLVGRVVDSSNVIALKKETFEIKKKEFSGKYISFMPFCGKVANLKLKGFKYTLEGYDLKPGESRCISNELENDVATVSFDNGYLLVIESLDIETE